LIYVRGMTLPEVWQNAFIQLAHPRYERERIVIPTQYDGKDTPPSIDDTCLMYVEEPMTEPRIHMCIPGGWTDLQGYVEEVVDGSRDHLSRELSYTYHDRLTNYKSVDSEILESENEWSVTVVDQLRGVMDLLRRAPYSRRAQAITWIPGVDQVSNEPPCLQSIWCRVVTRDVGPALDMHVRFRSRDAYNGAFMNMYALTMLQSKMAEELGVNVGHYVDISDSFHVYGNKLEEARRYVENMSKRMEERGGRSNFISTSNMRKMWETEEAG
jgi:thymidylate synthase